MFRQPCQQQPGGFGVRPSAVGVFQGDAKMGGQGPQTMVGGEGQVGPGDFHRVPDGVLDKVPTVEGGMVVHEADVKAGVVGHKDIVADEGKELLQGCFRVRSVLQLLGVDVG